MSSTVTNYSQNINTSYPVPGVDNDTQGFRDNFSNIKNALTIASTELSYLQSNTAKLDENNDFNYNKIYRSTLLGTGYYSPNITSISSNTSVSFLQGSYQKFSIEDNLTFTVDNWPSNTILGQIRLEIYNATSSTSKTVNFSGSLSKSIELTLPFTLSTSSWNKPIIFDLWTSDGGTTIFIDKVLDTGASQVPFLWDPNTVQTSVATAQYAITATHAVTVTGSTQTSITQIGTLTNLNVSGTIISNTSISNTSTINEKLSLSSANLVVNNSNIIISGVTGLTIENPSTISATVVGTWGVGPLGTTYIDVDSADDISVGSTFKLSQTEDLTHVVKSVDNVTSLRKRVYVDQYDENTYVVPDDIAGNNIQIKNGNLYNSVYYSSSEPKNLYGKAGDRKGGIYVTTSMVHMSYLDYTNTSTNMWTQVPTLEGFNNRVINVMSTLSNTVNNLANTVTTLVSTVTSNVNSISSINSTILTLSNTVTNLVSSVNSLSSVALRWAQYQPLFSTGNPGDKKGDIYANTTTLYICFQDYVSSSIPCWVKTNAALW